MAFAVSVVSQVMHSPHEEHFQVVYKILRYLKKTPRKGLLFKKRDHMSVEAFTDANWVRSVSEKRSTSRYCTFVGGCLITWKSKKQSIVSRHSVEAEFRALTLGTCEFLWLRRLLQK